jgi:hypothetical protein
MSFATNSVERARIDSAGKVGIGTSSPTDLLTVSNGSIASTIGGSGAGLQMGRIAMYSTALGAAFTNYGGEIRSFSGAGIDVSDLRFYTANGAATAERMRIDASGNVGIGTTSPAYKLDVRSGATATAGQFNSTATTAYNPSGYNGGAARLFMSGANAVGSFTGTQYTHGGSFEAFFGAVQNASNLADFVFQGYNGSAYAERMRIDSSGNVGIGTSSPAQKLSVNGNIVTAGEVALSGSDFVYSWAGGTTGQRRAGFYLDGTSQVVRVYTAQNEVARFDSSGNLLVGTTSALDNGRISVDFPVATANGITLQTSGTSYFNNLMSFRNSSGTQVGYIYTNGSTTTFASVSDTRLKENITDADSAGSIIDSIQVRKYDWKADGSHQRYGFVAQELAAVAPEAVHQPEDPDAMMGVDYSKLVPMLVKELQSLRARVAELEGK